MLAAVSTQFMTEDTNGRWEVIVERFGVAGLVAMLVAHLVWDPALTLIGVAEFGIDEEDTGLVRSMLRIHPAVWLAAKVVVLGSVTWIIYKLGIHRDPATAWFPWLVAVFGILGPLGWLELLV
jgi:hypothetical protein